MTGPRRPIFSYVTPELRWHFHDRFVDWSGGISRHLQKKQLQDWFHLLQIGIMMIGFAFQEQNWINHLWCKPFFPNPNEWFLWNRILSILSWHSNSISGVSSWQGTDPPECTAIAACATNARIPQHPAAKAMYGSTHIKSNLRKNRIFTVITHTLLQRLWMSKTDSNTCQKIEQLQVMYGSRWI